MAEFTLIKHPGNVWLPASEDDRGKSEKLALGIQFTGKTSGSRNVVFHRKFFALLNLGFDSWEPKGGLVTPMERRAVSLFVGFLGRFTAKDPLARAADQFFGQLEVSRTERYPAPTKSFEVYRKWVVEEAGFYDLVTLPDGSVRKAAKSIKFSKMDQAEFDQLYQSALTVIWRHVLVGVFASEAEVDQAVNQLMGYF